MESPKISIITPIYKSEDYLDNCITQLLNQDYHNLEIILVNDGSPDNSGAICDRYAKDYEQIVVVHKENGGASSARNAGIERATGEYICFVDSDDVISQSYVTQLYDDLCLNPQADLVLQGFIQRWEDRERIFTATNGVYSVKDGDLPRFFCDLLVNDYSGPYCKLFRKCLLEENEIRFSTAIIYAEDLDFLLQYILCANIIVTSTVTNYVYLMHNGSVSSKVYTFDKELSGIRRLFESYSEINRISNSEYILDSRKKSILNYFSRLITSNYTYSYTRKERIQNLSSVDLKIVKCYVTVCNTQTFFMRLIGRMLQSRKYKILDILLYFRLVILK